MAISSARWGCARAWTGASSERGALRRRSRLHREPRQRRSPADPRPLRSARHGRVGVLRLPGASTYLPAPARRWLLLAIGRPRGDDEDCAARGRRSTTSPIRSAPPAGSAAGSARDGAPTDYDAHAFLWWPRKRLAFVPYSGADWESWPVRAALGDGDSCVGVSGCSARAERGDARARGRTGTGDPRRGGHNRSRTPRLRPSIAAISSSGLELQLRLGLLVARAVTAQRGARAGARMGG